MQHGTIVSASPYRAVIRRNYQEEKEPEVDSGSDIDVDEDMDND